MKKSAIQMVWGQIAKQMNAIVKQDMQEIFVKFVKMDMKGTKKMVQQYAWKSKKHQKLNIDL